MTSRYLFFTFGSSFRVAVFVPGPSERVVNSRLALFSKLLVCHRTARGKVMSTGSVWATARFIRAERRLVHRCNCRSGVKVAVTSDSTNTEQSLNWTSARTNRGPPGFARSADRSIMPWRRSESSKHFSHASELLKALLLALQP